MRRLHPRPGHGRVDGPPARRRTTRGGAKIAFDLATLFARIGVIPIDIRVPVDRRQRTERDRHVRTRGRSRRSTKAAGKGILQADPPVPGGARRPTRSTSSSATGTMPATGALSVGPKNPGNTTGGTPLALANTTGLDDVAVAIGARLRVVKPSEWSFGGVDAPRDIADLKFPTSRARARKHRPRLLGRAPAAPPAGRNVVIPGRDSVRHGPTFDVQGRKPSGRSSRSSTARCR